VFEFHLKAGSLHISRVGDTLRTSDSPRIGWYLVLGAQHVKVENILATMGDGIEGGEIPMSIQHLAYESLNKIQ
jgi:hypothetical protein